MNRIADDVHQLPLTPRNGVNAFVIGDVLIDTGLKLSAKKILGALRASGTTISAIALTHAHLDHAGGMRAIVAELGVPVWCGAADREAVETGKAVPSSALDRPILRDGGNFAGSPVARSLAEGDELVAGFTVLDTPGHSPGHVSFWRESDRTLICGDVFNTMSLVTTKVGLHEPPAMLSPDPARNRASERRLADLEPRTLGVGHGPVFSDDTAAKLRAFVATRKNP